jgi:hypothetical protein
MSAFRPWMRDVKAGDVLEESSGSLRVVRKVRVWRNKRSGCEHITLWLAIRHCSWTHRPYTVIGTQDVHYRGFRPVGKRVRLTKAIDKKLAHDVNSKNAFNGRMTCCDVKGVP